MSTWLQCCCSVNALGKGDNIQVPPTSAKACLDASGESKGQRHPPAKELGLSHASHPAAAFGSSQPAPHAAEHFGAGSPVPVPQSGVADSALEGNRVYRGPAGSAAPAEREKQQDDDNVSVASVASTRSNRSTLSFGSVSSELINDRIPARQREAARIQQTMKAFVRQMVRGQQMGVISPDGQLRTCTCSLDKRLKHYVIELKGSQRKIPLTSIAEVYQGNEPEDIDTPLDEFCSTLQLDQGECITFHFTDVPAREQFAMCLQLLVDGQH